MHFTGTESSPYNPTIWYYVPSLFTLNIGEDDPDHKVSEYDQEMPQSQTADQPMTR